MRQFYMEITMKATRWRLFGLSPEFHSRMEAFLNYHNANPHIYKLFCKYSIEAIAAGKTRLSAWLIMNRIRWDEYVETDGHKYKIPNDFIAFYARLFMAENFEYDGYFVTKKMKYEDVSGTESIDVDIDPEDNYNRRIL